MIFLFTFFCSFSSRSHPLSLMLLLARSLALCNIHSFSATNALCIIHLIGPKTSVKLLLLLLSCIWRCCCAALIFLSFYVLKLNSSMRCNRSVVFVLRCRNPHPAQNCIFKTRRRKKNNLPNTLHTHTHWTTTTNYNRSHRKKERRKKIFQNNNEGFVFAVPYFSCAKTRVFARHKWFTTFVKKWSNNEKFD